MHFCCTRTRIKNCVTRYHMHQCAMSTKGNILSFPHCHTGINVSTKAETFPLPEVAILKSMILFQLLITQFFWKSQSVHSFRDVFYTHFLFCNCKLRVLHRGESFSENCLSFSLCNLFHSRCFGTNILSQHKLHGSLSFHKDALALVTQVSSLHERLLKPRAHSFSLVCAWPDQDCRLWAKRSLPERDTNDCMETLNPSI